jgi:cytochrome c553
MLRLPALGLAAALLCGTGEARAQPAPPAERLEQCGSCHGEDGNSKIELMPSIAGQPALFLTTQLVLIRETVRPVEAMLPFVKDLKDPEIEALARHYAALPAKPSDETVDPALAKRGAQLSEQRRCGTCHKPDLSGDQQIPRVGKQRIDYLVKALKEFRDGTRPGADLNMSVPVAGLSDADLTALAHYAAGR